MTKGNKTALKKTSSIDEQRERNKLSTRERIKL
jgi:hypothetical protein